ncbi:MAG TPA: NUDIX domain-containing protein [Thermoanaerobaculia bacterium]|nr:NUDIX domain-containing protein [Thermoanaerobaculia bacterium]
MPAPSGSSLIDWVDAADKPIAKIRRSQVFQQRAGFRVVHVFVFNEEGELLLQQLGRNRDRNPLKWGSSVAGYLNADEPYLDGAIRRLREELGVVVPLTKFGSAYMLDQGAKKFITLYLASSTSVAVGEPDHIESLRFQPVQEIQDWLQRSPEDFTETFRFLFRFYLSTLNLITEAG